MPFARPSDAATAPSRRSLCSAASLGTVLALWLCACGGVNFNRAEGAPRFKRLKSATPVHVVDDASELAQPAQVVGTFVFETDYAAEDRTDLVETLKKKARVYGCNAVVGLKREESQQKSYKREKYKEDGKTKYRKVEVVVRKYAWQASCVRAADAPGGLSGSEPVPVQPPPPDVAGNGGSDSKNGGSDSKTDGKTDGKTNGGSDGKTDIPFEKPPTVVGGGKDPAKKVPQVAVTKKASELWQMLKPFDATFLEKLERDLARAPKSTFETLLALRQLMTAVSGPDGFWNQRVPDLFGCKTSPDSPGCKKLGKLREELVGWQKMYDSLAKLEAEQANGWLESNFKDARTYVATVVPPGVDLAALQSAPLFKKHFK